MPRPATGWSRPSWWLRYGARAPQGATSRTPITPPASLRDPDEHAEWLRAVRQAASEDGYPLVINARIDVFLDAMLAGAGPGTQEGLVPEALRRAAAYLEAGVDCVYPIVLWEPGALQSFMAEVRGAVNVARLPQAPPLAELAALGVARVSWGHFLYLDAMARFADQLASLQE